MAASRLRTSGNMVLKHLFRFTDVPARVCAQRASILQDVEGGRPTELESLLGVVIEIAKLVDTNTPSLQLIYDLVKFRSRVQSA